VSYTLIKECKRHGEVEFRLTGSKWYCPKCNSESVSRRRRARKALLVAYKGGKCELCGYDRCIGALEFHHLDPTAKEFGISGKYQTCAIEKAKAEVDKCILVCANCHREIESGLVAQMV
jgi:predicted RNA-binding Zn-ribbon protein involved in translation (DUF1610 family)